MVVIVAMLLFLGTAYGMEKYVTKKTKESVHASTHNNTWIKKEEELKKSIKNAADENGMLLEKKIKVQRGIESLKKKLAIIIAHQKEYVPPEEDSDFHIDVTDLFNR
jgi:hypothetical protein